MTTAAALGLVAIVDLSPRLPADLQMRRTSAVPSPANRGQVEDRAISSWPVGIALEKSVPTPTPSATLYVMFRLGARCAARIAALFAGLACLATLCVVTAPARAASPLRTALTDDVWYDGVGAQWIPRTVATRAGLVLLELDWSSAEPTPPPAGANPTNPSGPEYDFSAYDAVIRKFAGTGIQPAFLVTDAPSWAEAPGGPPNFEARGAWQPNATAFGEFAAALARRYSGSFPDPAYPGRALPRVRYYQAWGEANFSIHLAPQWVRSGASWVPAGPGIYRNLLNAFYAGIKSVHADNFVITTGFGPYGDSPGGCSGAQGIGSGCRMPPAMFARELLCLHGEGLRPESCRNPAHFDAMAMDPYEVGSPTTHAYAADDVSAPDLGKLTRVLNKAGQLGHALPRGHKQLWVTEFSYDSDPPNPGGVSLATQARWVDQALYMFWSEGVSTAVWYLIRDQAPTYNADSYFSGLYFYNGAPKPAFEAFRFPFVVLPSGRSVTVWGIPPKSGRLAVQRKQGRSWKTLFRIRATADTVFVHNISPGLHGNFRALVGSEASVAWSR